jgi:PAS domain S-box-containing protein
MHNFNIDNLPIAMLEVNRNHIITYANKECLKLFGYSKLEGEVLEILIPKELRARHLFLSKKYFENPNLEPLGLGRDFLGLKSDDTTLPVELGLYPLDDGTILVLIVDIRTRIAKTKVVDKAKNIL